MMKLVVSLVLLASLCLACDVSKAKYWADQQWNCATPSCSSRVPAGSGQPSYECAEFVSRSLAYGGCIDIDPHAPQSDYLNYKYGNLLMTTGLGSALDKLGFHRKGTSASDVQTGCAVVGNGGDGAWSHAAFGVGNGIVDAHNNARYQLPVKDIMYLGIDEIWCP